MFFALNGKPPYNSETDSQFDIFTKIVYEPLPEFSIDNKFNEIILKACQKNREDRIQSCNEWLAFLNIRDGKNFHENDFEKKNADDILPTIVNDPKSSWFSNKNSIIGAIILFVIPFIVFIFSNQTKGTIDNPKSQKKLEITEKNKKDQVETAVIAKKKEKVEKKKITIEKSEKELKLNNNLKQIESQIQNLSYKIKLNEQLIINEKIKIDQHNHAVECDGPFCFVKANLVTAEQESDKLSMEIKNLTNKRLLILNQIKSL